jgi:hypothetical protein
MYERVGSGSGSGSGSGFDIYLKGEGRGSILRQGCGQVWTGGLTLNRHALVMRCMLSSRLDIFIFYKNNYIYKKFYYN